MMTLKYYLSAYPIIALIAMILTMLLSEAAEVNGISESLKKDLLDLS